MRTTRRIQLGNEVLAMIYETNQGKVTDMKCYVNPISMYRKGAR